MANEEKALNKQFEIETNVQELRGSPRMKIAAIVVSILFLIIIIVIIVGVSLTRKYHKVQGQQGASYGCKSFSRPATILIILDGFRFDYLDRGYSPNILKLASNGVEAEGMRSQYPTNTFPNIFSLFTGLYPETHGVVANDFLNGNRTERFDMSGTKKQKTAWFGGEPIWITAKKNGLKTAIYPLWGKNTKEEEKPDYWYVLDKWVPYEKRVDKVLEWLGLDSQKRPYFLLFYLSQIDKMGHKFGPDSKQTNDAIKSIDAAIGRLVKGIQDQKLTECVNLVLVSDHGMTNVSCSKFIYLDQMTSLKNITTTEQRSLMFLYTKNKEDAKKVTNELKCKNKNLQVYSKHDNSLPKRFHFTNNKRIGDIILIPKLGWQIFPKANACVVDYKGFHGYDNAYTEMLALFVANGPSFKQGLKFPQFSSVEVYNLLTEILKMTPAPNNGTYGSLSAMLKTHVGLIRSNSSGDENEFSNDCSFPKNLTSAVNDCKYCTCPYCSYDILNNLDFYRKSLDLSKEEIQASLKTHLPWGVPKGGAGKQGCLLTQKHYVIGYSGYLHVPLWVGYNLTREQLLVNVFRKNCFRRDIRLKSQYSSFCSDYSRSGYDRGHLAPSGDFNFDRVAEQDTFVLSNIAPQNKYFNRYPGLWFRAEDLVRDWAKLYGSVYVLSGSIFDEDGDGLRDDDTKINSWIKNKPNTVAIPSHFYKIIVRCNKSAKDLTTVPGCKGKLEALSFVFPHNHEKDCKLVDWKTRMMQYTASISDIEKLTGSTFFPNLPFPFSARFKSSLTTELWPST